MREHGNPNLAGWEGFRPSGAAEESASSTSGMLSSMDYPIKESEQDHFGQNGNCNIVANRLELPETMTAKNAKINMRIAEHVANAICKTRRCKTIIRIEEDYVFATGPLQA